MPMGDSRELIRRIADEIWNRGELAAVDEVMSVDARYCGPHVPGGVGSRDTWRQLVGMYRGAFPDSHVEFEELLECGDTVVGRWSATGTHTGPLLEPTGKRIAISGITIYRIRRGKIAEAWEELDLLGMWRQLGVVSLPGHE